MILAILNVIKYELNILIITTVNILLIHFPKITYPKITTVVLMVMEKEYFCCGKFEVLY